MTMKMGVEYEMMIKALTTLTKDMMNSHIVQGMPPSTVSISVENLFKILPVGVVSKKDIG